MQAPTTERDPEGAQDRSGEVEDQGISLLGVAGSLAILALLAVVAIPRFFHRPEVTLDNAARLVVSDVAAAQNLAAYLRSPVVVVFNEHGYRARQVSASVEGSDSARIGRSYESFGIFEGVALGDFDLGSDGFIVFDENGRIDETSCLTVHFGEHQRVVRFQGPEGIGSIQDPGSIRGAGER